ncbi:MAG TPA: hypothetical protein VNK73_00450 [Actinomycetota bacterium]|nr:hypothetical protein [Actinomycetota bacterium]
MSRRPAMRPRPGRWLAVRLGLALVAAAALPVVQAGPAAAHGVGVGLRPTNYRTDVIGIIPSVPGLEVRVREAGDKLELHNSSGREVLVLGYSQEPYLRVGPQGVFENRRSPTSWANRSVSPVGQAPDSYDPNAPPDWDRISSGTVAVWPDQRSHWVNPSDPPEVRRARGQRHLVVPSWRVPLRQGERTLLIVGTVTWVPGPSPLPWVLVAAVLVAAVLVAVRTPGWRVALMIAIGLAVVADVLHTAGSWLASTASAATKTYGMSVSVAAWVVGGLTIARLVARRDQAARTYLLLAAVFLLLAGAALDLSVLADSQLPSTLSPVLTRASVAVVLGLGTGMVVVALRGFPSERKQASQRPRSRSR